MNSLKGGCKWELRSYGGAKAKPSMIKRDGKASKVRH